MFFIKKIITNCFKSSLLESKWFLEPEWFWWSVQDSIPDEENNAGDLTLPWKYEKDWRLTWEYESSLFKGDMEDLWPDKEVNLGNITLDRKLTKIEIEEAKKVQYLNQRKIDILFHTQDLFKEFINSEYRSENVRFLKWRWKTIENAQTKLNEKLWIEITKDNVFWKETFLTIIRFQKENSLEIDGLIWPKTYKKLFWEDLIDPNSGKEEKWNNQIDKKKENEDSFDWTEMLALNYVEERATKALKNWDDLWAADCTHFASKILWVPNVNALPWGFRWSIRDDGDEWTWLIPLMYASKNDISRIDAWQHLLVDQPKNWEYWRWKTHSVVSLWKADNWLINVMSIPEAGKKPRKQTYDLLWLWRWDQDWKLARTHVLTA